MHTTKLLLSLLLLPLLPGCPSKADDTGPGTSPPDLTEPLGPDEARAGQLTEADDGAFLGGTAGTAAPGDFLLYNDRARFVVRGLHRGHGYVGEPGALIDLDLVRPAGQADRDGLDELLTMAGFGLLFVAETAEVENDGQDGTPAVLSMTGHDNAIPYVEGMLESPGLFTPRGLEIVQTFTLAPGSPALEITTEITNVDAGDLTLSVVDAAMADIAPHAVFVPGAGFDGEAEGSTVPYVAMVSQANDQAWGIFQADADLDEGLSSLAASLQMLLAQGPSLDLPEGATLSHTRLVAVTSDLSALDAWRRDLRGLPTGTVSGHVVTDDGTPVAGARVFLTDPDGVPLSLAFSAEDGSYTLAGDPGPARVVAEGDGGNEVLDLPGGQGAWGAHARTSANERAALAWTDPSAAQPAPLARGYGRSVPLDVVLEDGTGVTADPTFFAPVTLHLQVSDPDGTPLPAVILVRFLEGDSDPAPPDARLGEVRPDGNRVAGWTVDGDMELSVPPGAWEVLVHHGPRYDTWRSGHLVPAPGERIDLQVTLTPEVPMEGWISADFHAHGAPGIDGDLTMEERLFNVVANDVQIHVSTDHDQAADYRPLAVSLGLDPWMRSLPGTEASSNVRGHANLVGFEPDPTLPNGGSPRWWEVQVSTCDLYDLYRDFVGPDGIIQVNHGRDDGLFSTCDWDPESGTPGNPDRFCDTFDTMEILNGGDIDDGYLLREDWCSLLDQGLRPVAMGNSDSHDAFAGSGYSRNHVRVSWDEVDDDGAGVVAAVKAGHTVATTGPYVDLTATDGAEIASIGDTLAAGSATLHVKVQAPSWMPVDEVRLYGPGCEVLQTWTVDPTGAVPPTWFETEVEVNPGGEAYYFVEVEGWTDLDPVWSGGRAYAITNPVFLVP